MTLDSDDEDIIDRGKLLDIPDEEIEEILAEPAIPEVPLSDNLTVSLDTGPKQIKNYITTNLNSAVIAANKIKNKYRRKIIGNKKNKKDNDDDDKNKKTSTEWLKAAGYLDTKDQDAIRYLYVPPKKQMSPVQMLDTT